MKHDKERENDLQRLCLAVLTSSVRNTGDSGTGAECPFCYKNCSWNADSVCDIEHELNCAVLIAKDLSTNALPG